MRSCHGLLMGWSCRAAIKHRARRWHLSAQRVCEVGPSLGTGGHRASVCIDRGISRRAGAGKHGHSVDATILLSPWGRDRLHPAVVGTRRLVAAGDCVPKEACARSRRDAVTVRRRCWSARRPRPRRTATAARGSRITPCRSRGRAGAGSDTRSTTHLVLRRRRAPVRGEGRGRWGTQTKTCCLTDKA